MGFQISVKQCSLRERGPTDVHRDLIVIAEFKSSNSHVRDRAIWRAIKVTLNRYRGDGISFGCRLSSLGTAYKYHVDNEQRAMVVVTDPIARLSRQGASEAT